MSEWKIGDELVCSDVETYLNIDNKWVRLRQEIVESSLIVDHIHEDGALGLEGIDYCIPVKDFEYFKKKEQCTFNDLIDVAVQAVKDGLIKNLDIRYSYIEFEDGKERYNYAAVVAGAGIRVIQSLYKETFVIESEEDLKRIKVGAEITLANGIKSIAQRVYQYGETKITVKLECCTSSMEFAAFKGATVEQERTQ